MCKLKKKEVLKCVLVAVLVAALLWSTYLNININNSLQASLENDRNALHSALFGFRVSVGEATHIDSEPNEDNIRTLVEDVFDEMFNSWMLLRVIEDLNPELRGYEKPLYFVDNFICYTFISGESFTGGPNVRSVMGHLLTSSNCSIPVTAFKELNQISFKKIDELAIEVTESFSTPFNATRLNNTINMVEELQGILNQWIAKYSDYEINSSTAVVGQFQNVTIHEGDITIGNNATFLIENCQFNLTGKLIIRDRAEVIIRNATFISNWDTSEVPEKLGANPWRTRHVIVERQAKLTVLNSELIFSATYPWHGEYHSLILYDQATANMTESKITYANGRGDYIWACNDSELWIKDVTISTFKPENPWYSPLHPKNGLVIAGESQVEVQNSTLDIVCIGTVYEGGTSTVNLLDSNIELFETHNDSSAVNITDSSISQLTIYGPNSNVRLVNATLDELIASGSSKVWLIDSGAKKVSVVSGSRVWLLNSSVKEIYKGEKAEVWVVWDLPFFGQVAVPHAWAPYIFPVIALIITSIVIVAVFFLIRRKRGVKSKLGVIPLEGVTA